MNRSLSLLITFLLSTCLAQAALPTKFEDRPVIVAVIDTGYRLAHDDSNPELWTNRGETGLDALGRPKEMNGVDDDGNGYVDDVNGWDFVRNQPLRGNPVDSDGHGTHVSNIIMNNANAFGRARSPAALNLGFRRPIQLMILRYYDSKIQPELNIKRSVAALEYAVLNGASIINYSGGGNAPNKREFAALMVAERRGVPVVSAAGNSGQSNEKIEFFPASYNLSNVIPVVALDQTGKLHTQSNYTLKKISFAAPGEKILARGIKGFAEMTGTSQATAYVSGLLAGFMSQGISRSSVGDWIELLAQTASYDPSLTEKMKVPLKVSLEGALEKLEGFYLQEQIRRVSLPNLNVMKNR